MTRAAVPVADLFEPARPTALDEGRQAPTIATAWLRPKAPEASAKKPTSVDPDRHYDLIVPASLDGPTGR